jgi:heme-degrading monooxygenase HmoA
VVGNGEPVLARQVASVPPSRYRRPAEGLQGETWGRTERRPTIAWSHTIARGHLGSGIGHHGAMSVVKINALTVPEAMRAELERRFAARAGEVSSVEGFEYFELLRPVDGTDRYLVYTRWRSEEDFRRWQESQAFQRGHAQHAASGPAATAAELWSFEVVESEGPKPTHS